MKRGCATQWVAVMVGFGGVLVGPVWAERIPTPGALDARVRSVPYEADQVVRLQGQVGYALELVFESGETFAGLASGDLTGVDFTAQGEHLFLKPTAAGVATNLTVLTDRRVYRFSYVITDGNNSRVSTPTRGAAHPSSPRSGEVLPAGDTAVPSAGLRDAVLWSVRFVYPPTASGKDTAVPQVLNERYQFCGARQLKPRRVFDDGVRTTIEFDDRQELPAVFVRNPDGSESLVNFSVVGAGLIVHRVVEHLILRRGSLTACLRRAARPADRISLGTDPSSSTLTPAIRGAQHTAVAGADGSAAKNPGAGAAHGSSQDDGPSTRSGAKDPKVGGDIPANSSEPHGGAAHGSSSGQDRPVAAADGTSPERSAGKNPGVADGLPVTSSDTDRPVAGAARPADGSAARGGGSDASTGEGVVDQEPPPAGAGGGEGR